MGKRIFKKTWITLGVLVAVMLVYLVFPATGINLLSKSSEAATEKKEVAAKERVSVHDPSIVKDGGTYYVFGSHIEAAKSTDLQNWTKFTNDYTTPGNVLYGDLSANLAGSFAWAGEDDADSKGGFSVWAPCVFWNENFVGTDGTTGAYMIYYCTSSTYKRSCIGYAVSQNIEGPYTYVDTIVYSGFTSVDAYDTNSDINTIYTNTNIKTLIDNGTLTGVNSSWFNSNGSYNTSYSPNAIDPDLFYDEDGKLWMAYGSWSGGIYLLQIDEKTGKAIYPGKDGVTEGGNTVDRYFGTKIAAGYTKSGEGPYVVYDKTNGYYYLYISYASLTANGGYNIRMFRSTNAEGPYVDAAGNKATLPSATDNAYCGIKLIGNYKFNCLSVGYRAAGHNSSFIDSDGQMYLVYHTRFDAGTEYHEVRVHQQFLNEKGWPVTAPYEYSGDKISKTGYSMDEIVGSYEFINHGTSNGTTMLETLNIKLEKNFKVTGDVTGTWDMKKGTYYMDITIDGVTYNGVFFKQQDESGYNTKVMTFSAIGSNNESIWGSKLYFTDKEAVDYVGTVLESKMPESTKTDLDLSSKGPCDTKINWTSSNKKVIDTKGKVTRQAADTEVTLTAKITKGKATLTKTFTVTVKQKLETLDVKPIYEYNFSTVNDKEVVNSGTKSGNATLVGTASVVQDTDRGSVLNITNANGTVKVNYLALPSSTFDGITGDGYTVGMWVNVDTKDASYWEHSALFEANGGGQDKYPVTRISANLYGRINAGGAWADATNISKPLTGGTWQYVVYTVNSTGIVVYLDNTVVGTASANLAACFTNNLLANMTDVRVGSGNIWGDEDIASAKFDNISIFNTALSEVQVEALYNQEVKAQN